MEELKPPALEQSMSAALERPSFEKPMDHPLACAYSKCIIAQNNVLKEVIRLKKR